MTKAEQILEEIGLEIEDLEAREEIEAIADVIEMGKCFFGVDPGYFGIPDAHEIELAQARALYEAGYRKINT